MSGGSAANVIDASIKNQQNMARRLLIPLLISIVQTVSAQEDLLTVPRGIVLPWDSTARVRLLASLNGFLSEK